MSARPVMAATGRYKGDDQPVSMQCGIGSAAAGPVQARVDLGAAIALQRDAYCVALPAPDSLLRGASVSPHVAVSHRPVQPQPVRPSAGARTNSSHCFVNVCVLRAICITSLKSAGRAPYTAGWKSHAAACCKRPQRFLTKDSP
ncbi:hypothetical protein CBM2634_A10163 [Cupriavidus taiwanensis]|uniref:Uncharacterized protein n=1 Tax=Cupriavidus taiwanensis TaxID=164546 RepID=A0A375IWN5_9BURK|nr:hypothetical protein CBM2634_A10163 [Cupriavidus taiwanensis]